MTIKFFDGIAETASNANALDLTLSGAVAPWATFASVYANGDEVPYAIKDGTSGYEFGIGTYVSSGNKITRDYIIGSSNSGAAITCSGSQQVRCCGLAEHLTGLQRVKRPPLVAGLTTRAGSGTITDGNKGILITQALTAANTNSLCYAVTPIVRGGTSSFQFTVKLKRHFGVYQWAMTGLILRDSSSVNSVLVSIGNDSVIGFNLNRFSNDTTFFAVIGAFTMGSAVPMEWWERVVDDNTNRTWYFSLDGDNWVQIFTEAKSTYASSANQVGVVFNPNCGGTGQSTAQGKSVILEVCSWELKSF